MIPTLLRISRISLRRDRVAQLMVFVLPISFFTVFALVFGRPAMENMSPIRVMVADEDRSDASRALIRAMKADPALRARDSVATHGGGDGARAPLDPGGAEAMVRRGDAPVALIIPAGWGATFPDLTGHGMETEVLADPSDPVARGLVVGLLQRSAAVVLRSGMDAAGGSAGGGGAGGAAAENGARAGSGAAPAPGGIAGGGSRPPEVSLVRTRVTDVLGDRRGNGRMISFYAAGIAVMFLLFSCAAAGGSLLDEQDSGTLERVLNTRVGMTGLLAGKWIHLTLLGLTQITVMFLWGAAVFRLDLAGHLPGFLVMTLATAAAAAGFGLVLATLCRTRQQLGGISTILILVMSALGGSMFPRFLMSEAMQKIGLVTFNAWALDGYIKVFWRDARLVELWPQLLVLTALTAVFLALARWFARRWETA
jgi:ABC-2 type transport system permease protein